MAFSIISNFTTSWARFLTTLTPRSLYPDSAIISLFSLFPFPSSSPTRLGPNPVPVLIFMLWYSPLTPLSHSKTALPPFGPGKWAITPLSASLLRPVQNFPSAPLQSTNLLKGKIVTSTFITAEDKKLGRISLSGESPHFEPPGRPSFHFSHFFVPINKFTILYKESEVVCSLDGIIPICQIQ